MKNIVKKLFIIFILVVIYFIIDETNVFAKTEIMYIQDNEPEKSYRFGFLPATELTTSNLEGFNDIVVVDDGYIVVGRSSLFLDTNETFTEKAKGNSDAIIVKYNKDLGMEYFESFGGSFDEYFSKIEKTNDGGYLVYGATDSIDKDLLGKNDNALEYEDLCVKYSSDFKVEFVEVGEISDHTNIILKDNMGAITDGEITLTSVAGDLVNPDVTPQGEEINTVITKYDTQGYKEWIKIYDRNSSLTDDELRKVVEVDGKYVFIGTSTKEVERYNQYVQEAIIVEYEKPQTGILLNTYNYTVDKYDMIEPIAYVNYLDVNDDEIIWTSSDENIVKIDDKGRIIAVGVGSAKLKLKIRNKETQYDVYVEVIQGQATDSKIKEFSSDNDIVKVKMQGTESKGQSKQMLTVINNYRKMENMNDLFFDSYLKKIAEVRAAELQFIESSERPNGKTDISELLPENKKDTQYREYYFCGSYRWDEATNPEFYRDSMNPNTKAVGMSHFKVDGKMYHVFIFADEVIERYTALNNMDYPDLRYVEVLSKYLDNEVIINENQFNMLKGETNSDIEFTSGEWNLSNQSFEWNSLNENVATVDEYGKITAVGGGNTTIVAKIGETQFNINVHVDAFIDAISLDKETISLYKKENYTLIVSYNPVDTTSKKDIQWESGDTNIAEVDENGKITAKNVGTTIITAISSNGKKATCEVTVLEDPFLRGDINNDGKITIADLNYGLKRLTGIPLTEDEIKRGDITDDGKYTIADLNKMLKYLNKVINEI